MGLVRSTPWVRNTSYDPAGCFHFNGQMYFNTHPKGQEYPDRTPYCKPIKFTVGIPGTNTCPTGSTKMTTESECDIAATRYKLVKSTPWVRNTSYDPAGCFHFHGALYFNTHPEGQEYPDRTPFCKPSLYIAGNNGSNRCPTGSTK